jgi:hypothetical protein
VGDESILHKPLTSGGGGGGGGGGGAVPGSPTRKQGKENTSPGGRLGEFNAAAAAVTAQNPAALSRQEVYTLREQPAPPTIRKYNTQRGLTAEELETLQKPNVKRLANVTQLCEFFGLWGNAGWFTDWDGRFPRLLL